MTKPIKRVKLAKRVIRAACFQLGFKDNKLSAQLGFLSSSIGMDITNYTEKELVKFSIDLIRFMQTKDKNWCSRSLERLKNGKFPPNKKIRLNQSPKYDTSDKFQEFYKSWDWKRLRYDFLIDKERTCQCCGASAAHGVKINVDHIRPLRKYWELRLSKTNLQILCEDCNMGKGSRDETDWTAENVVPFKRNEH